MLTYYFYNVYRIKKYSTVGVIQIPTSSMQLMVVPSGVGRLLEKIYARYANPGLLSIAKKRCLPFDWVIEAGCHDGTDTLKFLSLEQVKMVFAFEPDDAAADDPAADVEFNRFYGPQRSGVLDVPLSVGPQGPSWVRPRSFP